MNSVSTATNGDFDRRAQKSTSASLLVMGVIEVLMASQSLEILKIRVARRLVPTCRQSENRALKAARIGRYPR
jgi:ABC-type uncharacterized transport system YnjBCD permease subunit